MTKRFFVQALAITAFLAFCVPFSVAQAEEQRMNPADLNSAIVEQISTVIHADNVLGQPVTVGEKTIVPVVCMFFGFGSGGSTIDIHTGTGGGGVGMVMPMSMLVISPEGELSIVEARKSQIAEVIKGLGMALLEKIESYDIKGSN